MSCYHPAFIQRTYVPHLKDYQYKFLGSDSNFLETNDLLIGNYTAGKIDGWSSENSSGSSFIQIPCGKCIGCRIDYSRSWADRMVYHYFGREECSYFLTLTYDEKHIFDLNYIQDLDIFSLEFRDMDLFIRRLRNNFTEAKVQYYYSGEYGDSNFRPHFHMIIYNVDFHDLKFYKFNDHGDPLYTSSQLDSLWGKGYVVVGQFNWLSAAYTASYVEKKRDGRKNTEYELLGLVSERCRCSRKPGLSYDFYIEHYDQIWKQDGFNVDRTVRNTGKLGIPRYFRKLAEDKGIGFDEYLDFKKRCLDRSNLQNFFKLQNSSFNADRDGILDMLKYEEREILNRSFTKSF